MTDQPTESAPPPVEPAAGWSLPGAAPAAAALRPRREGHPFPWGGKVWQTSLRAEIARIEAGLLEVDDSPHSREPAGAVAQGSLKPTARPDRVRDQIEDTLRFAASVLDEHEARRWISRVGRSGRTYEAALSAVQQAAEDLLLVCTDAAFLAQIPVVRAGVRSYLRSDDPRLDDYLRLCDRLVEAHQDPDTSGSASSGGHPVPRGSTGGVHA